jgi:hypothetical protein
MDLEGFKKFMHKGRSYKPKAVIRKSGHVAFNSGAVTKYDLDMYEYAILYISDNKQRVAVKFTNNEKSSGLIKIHKRAGNFSIAARSFLGIYDIDWSKTRNFDFLWRDKDKVAIFSPLLRKRGDKDNGRASKTLPGIEDQE